MTDLPYFLLHVKNGIHTSNANITIYFFNLNFTPNFYLKYAFLRCIVRRSPAFLIDHDCSFGKSDVILRFPGSALCCRALTQWSQCATVPPAPAVMPHAAQTPTSAHEVCSLSDFSDTQSNALYLESCLENA